MKDAIDYFLCRHPRCYLSLLRALGRGSLEKRVFLSVVRKGNVVFDIGANRGYFTRLFARIVGEDGAVHAFEPGPRAFELLRTRMKEAGGMPNFTLNHCALGEEIGVATLHLPGNDDGQAALRVHTSGSWSGACDVQHYECSLITLDQYAAPLPRLDFIKCDVEGAELAVLRGGRLTLARHRPLLWLESNPEWTCDFGYTPNDLIAALRTFGYDTFFAASTGLAPLAEGDLGRDVNLLCARADCHAKQLGPLSKI